MPHKWSPLGTHPGDLHVRVDHERELLLQLLHVALELTDHLNASQNRSMQWTRKRRTGRTPTYHPPDRRDSVDFLGQSGDPLLRLSEGRLVAEELAVTVPLVDDVHAAFLHLHLTFCASA